MRLKTLGAIVVTALALFTMFYWLTDNMRMGDSQVALEEEELEYAMTVFGPPDENNPATANCAQCHGPDGRGGGPDAPVAGPNLHSARVAERLRINPNYVHLVISYGGIVVSGDPNSRMPAWSTAARTISRPGVKGRRSAVCNTRTSSGGTRSASGPGRAVARRCRSASSAASRSGAAASTLARRPATNAGTMRVGSMNSRTGVASTRSMRTCASAVACSGWSRRRARTAVAVGTGTL